MVSINADSLPLPIDSCLISLSLSFHPSTSAATGRSQLGAGAALAAVAAKAARCGIDPEGRWRPGGDRAGWFVSAGGKVADEEAERLEPELRWRRGRGKRQTLQQGSRLLKQILLDRLGYRCDRRIVKHELFQDIT